MAVSVVGTVTHNEIAATGPNITALRNGILPGSALAVFATVEHTASITSIDDGFLKFTVPDVSLNWGAGTQWLAGFVIPNHPGGNRTFTATFSTSAVFRGIRIVELAGADLVMPVDGVSSASGSSAAPSAGAVPVSLDGSYCLGYALAATALTKGATFTELFNDPTVITDDTEGCTEKYAAPVTPVWTMASGIWAAIGLSIRPALVTLSGITPQARRG